MSEIKQKATQHVNFEERKALSQCCLRGLFNQALRIEKQEIKETLNQADIQEAKEYFGRWYVKKKEEYQNVYVLAFLCGLYFLLGHYSISAFKEVSFFAVVAVMFFCAVFVFSAFVEYETRKETYIKELLGSIEQIEKEKREHFFYGLKCELFGHGKEVLSVSKMLFIFSPAIAFFCVNFLNLEFSQKFAFSPFLVSGLICFLIALTIRPRAIIDFQG